MLDNLVLATPTYNSAEYLEVCLLSWVKYASIYPFVLVVDGSTDSTKKVIEKYVDDNLHVVYFDSNKGQPIAYNTCLKTARDKCGADYIFMLNDDMVFGPGWDKDLSKWSKDIDNGLLLSLYYAWPGEWGYGAVAYPAGSRNPKMFDMHAWAKFCESYIHPVDLVGKTGFGPGFPFIISSKMIDTYHFDARFHTGGVLDTDFLFTMFLDGYPMERLAQNLLFHFSGGSTDKQKAQGIWIEHGPTFKEKWGIDVGFAQWAITGTKPLPSDELVRLKELQNRFRFSTI